MKTLRSKGIHLQNYQFFSDIFLEPNPVPIKTLIAQKGLISSPEVRLPLTPPSKQKTY